MFKRILVALDGSQLAENILPYVTDIASRFRSQVHLGTFAGEPEKGLGRDLGFEAYLGRHAETLKESKITAKTAVLSGNPSEKILDYAESNKVDLIAITSIGKGGTGRWKLGSVAERLSTTSPAPVLMVPVTGGVRTPEAFFTRILVPVDVSELGAAALPCVFALGPKAKSSVTLLYVEPVPYAPTQLARRYYEETAEYLRKNVREYLEKTAKEMRDDGIETSYDIITGDPADQILTYAKDRKYDLIAMSTHGRTGIVRWALGSVANKVLHNTTSPLLLVRAPGAVCPATEVN
ncbi:MAG: universal stress protein [Dehalococcoidia bacterium]|nr:universal stress protein [Dehalococcoidia bacterium]